MAQLIVRGLDEEVKDRLQARAIRHGQSIEAEARDILCDALKGESRPTVGLGSRIAARFAGAGLKPSESLESPNWGALESPFES